MLNDLEQAYIFEDVRVTRIMASSIARKEAWAKEKKKREKLELIFLGMILITISVILGVCLYFDPLITPFMFMGGLLTIIFSMIGD